MVHLSKENQSTVFEAINLISRHSTQFRSNKHPTLYIGRAEFQFQVCGLDVILYYCSKMAVLLANNGDPDQVQHSVASDRGLHDSLPITISGVSRLSLRK